MSLLTHPAARRRARFVAQTGAIFSALVLLVTLWVTVTGAATNAGAAQVVDPTSGQPLASGGSSTQFTLKLPDSAACTGDSPNADYKVQSYMVPSTVDPASLQFGASGPNPPASGANFRRPLFISGSQSPYVNAQTAAASQPGGPGPIVNIPTFDFTVFAPGDIPAGTYNVGIACTLGPADADQLDKYWNTQMTFMTNPADSPAQVTWTSETTTTTTTTTTSTTSTSTTSTTTPGATTTTSTTTAPTTTTSTTAAPTTTTSTTAAPTTTTSTTTPGATTTTSTTTTDTTTTTTAAPGATATDANGNTIPPGSTLSPGQRITASGSGFTPGETTTFTVNSTPVVVGSAVADGSGRASASVVIPSNIQPGAHTLMISGASRTVTFPFHIAGAPASSGGQLPLTGSGLVPSLIWTGLLLMFGVSARALARPSEARGTDGR